MSPKECCRKGTIFNLKATTKPDPYVCYLWNEIRGGTYVYLKIIATHINEVYKYV